MGHHFPVVITLLPGLKVKFKFYFFNIIFYFFYFFLQEYGSVYFGSSDCVMVHKGMYYAHGFSYSSCRGFSFSDRLPMRLDLCSFLTPGFVLEFMFCSETSSMPK
jgi:hypothetical protein